MQDDDEDDDDEDEEDDEDDEDDYEYDGRRASLRARSFSMKMRNTSLWIKVTFENMGVPEGLLLDEEYEHHDNHGEDARDEDEDDYR